MALTSDRIELPVGVEVDGVLHTHAVIRTATVLDNIEATDELVERGEAPTALRISTALMARQLLELGTLRREQITTDLVRGMNPADWNVLDQASAALEKKARRGGPTPSSTGGSSRAPSSPDMASTLGT